MATLRKTVQIPADRRIHLDFSVPETVPQGDAEVLVVITASGHAKRRDDLTRLAGTLADSKTLAGDAVALQRKMRDEW